MSHDQALQRLPAELRRLAGKQSRFDNRSLVELGPIDEKHLVRSIIETPSGSRSKYDYDEDSGLFELNTVLPMGMAFPFDFGFIPRTIGGDGDPLDVMVLTDEPSYPGAMIRTRLIGVLKAEQTERSGQTVTNDRVLAVHYKSIMWAKIETVDQLPTNMRQGLEHFFENYNELKGKKFRPKGWFDKDVAFETLEETIAKYEDQRHGKRKAS